MVQLLICNHFNSLSSTVKRVRKMKGGRLNKNLMPVLQGNIWMKFFSTYKPQRTQKSSTFNGTCIIRSLEPNHRRSACHQQASLRFEGMLFIPTKDHVGAHCYKDDLAQQKGSKMFRFLLYPQIQNRYAKAWPCSSLRRFMPSVFLSFLGLFCEDSSMKS